MTNSEFRKACDNIQMDERKKEQIKAQLLYANEQSTNASAQNINAVRRHYSLKKRLVLVAAACFLIGSITAVATSRRAAERPHMQDKIYMVEGADMAILADRNPNREMYDMCTDQLQSENGANECENYDLSYDSLEKAVIELNLSPIVPDTTDGTWEITSFRMKKSSEDTEKNSEDAEADPAWRAADYFMNLAYANTEHTEQRMEVSLNIYHQEMDQSMGSWTSTAVPITKDMDSARVYNSTSGREYLLYDTTDAESGDPVIGVIFTYSDRYWINEITREQAYDHYNCEIICHDMSETEVYDMLDQLSILDLAY